MTAGHKHGSYFWHTAERFEMESNTEEVDNSFVSIEDCASRDNITNVENVRDGDLTVIDEATINLVTSVKKKKASKEQRKKWNKTAQQKSLLSDPKPGKKEKGLLALSNWNAKKRRQRHEDGVVPGRKRIFPHPQKRRILLSHVRFLRKLMMLSM